MGTVMKLRRIVFATLMVAIVIATTEAVIAAQSGLQRYKADLYCNFQFERSIEITFDPGIGNQRVKVFESAANISPSPASPPGGELVDLIKDGDEWSFHRASALKSATIKRDEKGKLIIFYFTRGGNYAEGELKPVIP